MNALNQLKWTISRKAKFQNLNKQISLQCKKPKSNQSVINKIYYRKLSPWEEATRKYITYYLSKSLKLIFKICFISFCFKLVFYHLRQYHKAYLRDLSYMQTYGYARRSDYENFMNGKDSYEFEIFPNTFFHTEKYNPKDPVNSFLKVFDKYINHPEFENELGKFLLMLFYYEPLRPPRNDFLSIILDEYIYSDDFMDSLYRLLRIWFLNDEFVNVLFERVQEAIFSEKVKYSLLDAFINELFILMELPEVRNILIQMNQYYLSRKRDKEKNDNGLIKSIEAMNKIVKKKVFYKQKQSIPIDDQFKLTRYNKFYLKTVYDFIHDDDTCPIHDFSFYENPLFVNSDSREDLYDNDDLIKKYKQQ